MDEPNDELRSAAPVRNGSGRGPLGAGPDGAGKAAAAWTDVLAHMAHEIRTPLHGVIGFADLLLSEYPGPLNARQKDCITSIAESSRHLLEVVSGVLDFARLEAGAGTLSDEVIRLDDAVADVHMLAEALIVQRGLHFGADIPADAPALLADRRALRQILLNLVSNAVKFTAPGGRIRVEARAESEEDGGGLALSVVDTGIGIEPAELPGVLLPFRQGSRQPDDGAEGTGLGLPIVKALMEAHRGRLELASTPGQGTRAVLRFPRERLLVAAGAGDAGRLTSVHA